eukprot:c19834_g1_i2.p1 GENE.c19834_g1_i2~~c19834_g1_i2.p1  ORF type:complete len:110 (+),score=57.63 c19834_g1_i2:835-1164(+)
MELFQNGKSCIEISFSLNSSTPTLSSSNSAPTLPFIANLSQNRYSLNSQSFSFAAEAFDESKKNETTQDDDDYEEEDDEEVTIHESDVSSTNSRIYSTSSSKSRNYIFK